MTLAAPADSPGHSSLLAVTTLGVSSFMITLDATALHVALPSIAQDLGGGLSALQWISNAYTLVFAGLLLSSGALSDRLGARTVFMAAMVFFTVASALCGLAPNTEFLIAARAVQGIGAAAILPSSMALLAHACPEPKSRARALGTWSTISAMALVAGPLLGGLLTDTVGWRAIFLLNIPVGLLALTAASISLGRPAPQPRAFDPAGQILGLVALISLAFSATEGGELGWLSSPILVAITIGLGSGIAFIAIERRHPDPVLPLELFRSWPFSAAIVTAFLYNFAYYGALFALSIALQTDGVTPMEVGLMFAPMTLVTTLSAFTLGRAVARYGAQRPAAVTLGVGALGATMLAFTGLSPESFLLGSLLLGVGGSTLPAIAAATLDNVPAGRTGIGSAVLNTARQTGGAFGVAVLGALLGLNAMDTDKFVPGVIAAAFLLAAAAISITSRTYRQANTANGV